MPHVDPPIRTPDPGAASVLLGHIPDWIQDTCQPEVVQFEEARALCRPAAYATLTYRYFDSPYAASAAFSWARTFAAEAGTMPGNGTCRDGGYLGSWPEGSAQPAGDLLCYQNGEIANIVWSDEGSHIIAYLDVINAGHAAAYDLWLTAGPV
jgi:hypothetical protein